MSGRSLSAWRPAFHLLVLLLSGGGRLHGGAAPAPPPGPLEKVGIDQKLDGQAPLDLRFSDESGRSVRLGDLVAGKPAILVLVYYRCPMLCNEVLNGLLRALRALSFSAGEEFRVLTVSIDPHEPPELAAAKKEGYLREYDRPGAAAGWRFLTGAEGPIRELADAVGFRYAYDPPSKQFAHAAGIMVLTGEGRISRYFSGIEFSSRDLKFALMEASEGRIGSRIDQLVLYCFRYDPVMGRYGLVIRNVLQLAAAATVILLGTLLGVLFWRERKKPPIEKAQGKRVASFPRPQAPSPKPQAES
jgi:protein SCO1